jgi:bifunctional non-homologous end joining protein LigD
MTAKQRIQFVEPELATLADAMPEGPDWIFEIKFDGYRMLATIDEGVTLVTRNNVDWTPKFSGIASSLATLTAQGTLLDGEVVSMTNEGVSNFEKLHDDIKANNQDALRYFVFDLLFLDGKDMRGEPLHERKRQLNQLLTRAPANVVFSKDMSAEEVDLPTLCRGGYEGVIAKLKNSVYLGGRNKVWLKVKCHKRQELVIGGFTEPTHANRGIGALLLGYFVQDSFVYAGKVGTGFNHLMANELRARLEPLRTDEMPFQTVPRAIERVGIFTRPEVVCEIEFTEWTEDGRLRHPSFQGLREDKPARDVGRDKELHVPH